MDKDVERVLLHQVEQRKQQLINEINELEQELNNNNNNMSEQTQSPYVGRKLNADQIEYKTFSNDTLAGLDADLTQAFNDGWQPAGPQYKADGWFYQPMVKVPRQMMPQQR